MTVEISNPADAPLPGHDPAAGQQTVAQAATTAGTVHPPHTAPAADDEQALSFDQCIRGIHQYYDSFNRVEAAYSALQDILAGEQRPPILPWPTGQTDSEGKLIYFDVDYSEALPTHVSEQDRLLALRALLEPLLVPISKEYHRCLNNLTRATSQALQQMTPA